jgi:hypothetical protein
VTRPGEPYGINILPWPYKCLRRYREMPANVARSLVVLSGGLVAVALRLVRASKWYQRWYVRTFGPLDQY